MLRLIQLQKRFLWQKTTKKVNPSRHKILPSLLYSPREPGGIDLIAPPIAIRVRRLKDTMVWLISSDDVYRRAWLSWLELDGKGHLAEISLRMGFRESSIQTRTLNSKPIPLTMEIVQWLGPDQAQVQGVILSANQHLSIMIRQDHENPRRTSKAMNSGQIITIRKDIDKIPHHGLMSQQMEDSGVPFDEMVIHGLEMKKLPPSFQEISTKSLE